MPSSEVSEEEDGKEEKPMQRKKAKNLGKRLCSHSQRQNWGQIKEYSVLLEQGDQAKFSQKDFRIAKYQ